jgi:hypothetical protein
MLLNMPSTMALRQAAKTRTQLMVAMQHTSNTINNIWQQQLSNLLPQAELLQVLLPRHLLAKHLHHHPQVQLRGLADTVL